MSPMRMGWCSMDVSPFGRVAWTSGNFGVYLTQTTFETE
jgi:hypothetical protein